MKIETLAKLTGRPAELVQLPVTGRYPRAALNKEIVKAGLGAGICLGIVGGLHPAAWVAWPIGLFGLLFLLYLTQQARRYSLRIRVDEQGLTQLHKRYETSLPWPDLKRFQLNYYPHGRKAKMGTLVLTLGSGRKKLKVDSTFDLFPTLLSRAAKGARENGVELNPTTVSNLEQLEL